MPVAITCASCRRALRVPESSLGKTVRCPLCTDAFLAESNLTPLAPSPVEELARAERTATVTTARASRPPWAAVETDQEEVLLAQPVGPVAVPRKTDDVAALPFKLRAKVKKDPYRIFKGTIRAEVSRSGLHLSSGRKDQAFVPVGTPVRYLGGNRIVVPLDDRDVELAVGNRTVYRQRLARDVARFLSGDRELPRPAEFRWPWYVYLLWLAPSGVPFFALGLDAAGYQAGYTCLLFFLAVPLFFVGQFLIQREKWFTRPRLALAAGVSATAYAAVAWAATNAPLAPVPASDWRSLNGGGFSVRMPGTVYMQNRIRDGQSVAVYVVDLKQQQAVYTFGYVDLPPGPQQRTEAQLNEVFDEGVRSLRNETPGVTRVSEKPIVLSSWQWPGREYLFDVPNPTLKGTMVARMYLVRNRLYTLVVAGKNVRPPSMDSRSNDVRTFFESFTVTWPNNG